MPKSCQKVREFFPKRARFPAENFVIHADLSPGKVGGGGGVEPIFKLNEKFIFSLFFRLIRCTKEDAEQKRSFVRVQIIMWDIVYILRKLRLQAQKKFSSMIDIWCAATNGRGGGGYIELLNFDYKPLRY